MKIFDCFPFFDELLLLDMRLHYLTKAVEKFILVEGTYSHQGLKKNYFLMRINQSLENIKIRLFI